MSCMLWDGSVTGSVQSIHIHEAWALGPLWSVHGTWVWGQGPDTGAAPSTFDTKPAGGTKKIFWEHCYLHDFAISKCCLHFHSLPSF